MGHPTPQETRPWKPDACLAWEEGGHRKKEAGALEGRPDCLQAVPEPLSFLQLPPEKDYHLKLHTIQAKLYKDSPVTRLR